MSVFKEGFAVQGLTMQACNKVFPARADARVDDKSLELRARDRHLEKTFAVLSVNDVEPLRFGHVANVNDAVGLSVFGVEVTGIVPGPGTEIEQYFWAELTHTDAEMLELWQYETYRFAKAAIMLTWKVTILWIHIRLICAATIDLQVDAALRYGCYKGHEDQLPE